MKDSHWDRQTTRAACQGSPWPLLPCLVWSSSAVGQSVWRAQLTSLPTETPHPNAHLKTVLQYDKRPAGGEGAGWATLAEFCVHKLRIHNLSVLRHLIQKFNGGHVSRHPLYLSIIYFISHYMYRKIFHKCIQPRTLLLKKRAHLKPLPAIQNSTLLYCFLLIKNKQKTVIVMRF